jgi:hypothetical protein
MIRRLTSLPKGRLFFSSFWKKMMPLLEFLVMHLASLRVLILDLFDEVHLFFRFYFPRSFGYDLPL